MHPTGVARELCRAHPPPHVHELLPLSGLYSLSIECVCKCVWMCFGCLQMYVCVYLCECVFLSVYVRMGVCVGIHKYVGVCG